MPADPGRQARRLLHPLKGEKAGGSGPDSQSIRALGRDKTGRSSAGLGRLSPNRRLAGRLASRAGLLDRWAVRLDDDEDLLWRTILSLYAELGRAPTRADMAAKTGMPDARLSTFLASLGSHD